MVKINESEKTATTCGNNACNLYLDIINNKVENKDGTLLTVEEIGKQYYKIIKAFNVTLNKEILKSFTDKIREIISKIHHTIIEEATTFLDDMTQTSNKRRRTEEVELDDDPIILSEGITEDIKSHIIQAVRDLPDDTFNAMSTKEELARFMYETVLAPYFAAEDFDARWLSRDEYMNG
jgi:DNA replication initiation complex subunit (GINS family)